MLNKYIVLQRELEEAGYGYMTCFGNSMLPILKSGQRVRFEKQDEYEIGDIVFCKVRGRYIDAHKITKKNKKKGYMIANNSGHENGWTRTIYGKAII